MVRREQVARQSPWKDSVAQDNTLQTDKSNSSSRREAVDAGAGVNTSSEVKVRRTSSTTSPWASYMISQQLSTSPPPSPKPSETSNFAETPTARRSQSKVKKLKKLFTKSKSKTSKDDPQQSPLASPVPSTISTVFGPRGSALSSTYLPSPSRSSMLESGHNPFVQSARGFGQASQFTRALSDYGGADEATSPINLKGGLEQGKGSGASKKSLWKKMKNKIPGGKKRRQSYALGMSASNWPTYMGTVPENQESMAHLPDSFMGGRGDAHEGASRRRMSGMSGMSSLLDSNHSSRSMGAAAHMASSSSFMGVINPEVEEAIDKGYPGYLDLME